MGGPLGNLEPYQQVYEHLQRDPEDIRFFARCIVEYLERKGHIMESEG